MIKKPKKRPSEIEGLKYISLVCQEIYENTILIIRLNNWVKNSLNIKYTQSLFIWANFTSFFINNLSSKSYTTTCKNINKFWSLNSKTSR